MLTGVLQGRCPPVTYRLRGAWRGACHPSAWSGCQREALTQPRGRRRGAHWCPAGFPEELRVTPWGGGRGLRPSEQRHVTASGGAESRRMGRGRAWRRVQGGGSAGPSGWGTAKRTAEGTGPGATNNAGPGLPSPLTPRGSHTALPAACTLPPRPSDSRMLKPQGSLGPGVSPGALRVPPAHQPQSQPLFLHPASLSLSFMEVVPSSSLSPLPPHLPNPVIEEAVTAPPRAEPPTPASCWWNSATPPQGTDLLSGYRPRWR